jgi:hypothetical protein
MKTKLHNCNMCRGPKSVPCRIPGWCFSLCEPLWSKVSRFCRFSCAILDRLAPTILPPQDSPSSDQRLPLVLCICFCQLLGEASLMTVMPGSCLQVWPTIMSSDGLRGGIFVIHPQGLFFLPVRQTGHCISHNRALCVAFTP